MKLAYKYWIRTGAGLENIAAHELSRKMYILNQYIKHRSVFWSLKDSVPDEILTNLKTADDIYYHFGSCDGVDNTKLSTHKILNHFERHVIPYLCSFSKTKNIRITLSFLGKRNFSRFYIENLLNKIVQDNTKHTILSNEKGNEWKTGELRIRYHIEDEVADCGIALQDKPLHRRKWRVESYPGQLHPPVAAAMIELIKLEESKDKILIDPFCGSGTILIESAVENQFCEYVGFDTNINAINVAKMNSKSADVNIKFFDKDFSNFHKQSKDFIIVSNPPWGEKHIIETRDINVFIDKLKHYISQSVFTILLIPEHLLIILKSKSLSIDVITTTRVKGKYVSIALVKNRK